jgi:hypothetical protein
VEPARVFSWGIVSLLVVKNNQKNSNNLSALIARFLLASSHTTGSTH